MSSELIPRGGEALRTLRSADPLAPHNFPCKIRCPINRELTWGLVNAARAQAAGFAADARIEAVELVIERAVLALDRLNHVEVAMAKQDPVKAQRVSYLVDRFVLVARNEIRRLPREHPCRRPRTAGQGQDHAASACHLALCG